MIDKITSWIKNYSAENKIESLVVGISGGIDSSVVSTLCALTNLEVYAVSMPINQIKSQHDLSLDHGNWLTRNYKNVHHFPACGDDGIAIGAALYLSHHVFDQNRNNYSDKEICYLADQQ